MSGAIKRVLVTGASGFIGYQCLGPLLARGYEVHALRSRSNPVAYPGVQWHAADLFDAAALNAVLGKINATHLLHLAWYVAPGSYVNHVDNLAWVQRSADLIRAFKEHGGQRAVLAGTCYEYDWRFGYCSEDVTPIAPDTFYGTCKHALHDLTRGFGAISGLSVAWGRIFFLYGPREHPQRLVSSVIRSLLLGQPAPCSHGLQVRDYMSVEDLGDAFGALVDSDVTGACNVASGQATTLKAIITRIGELLRRPDLIKLGAYRARANDVPLVVADTRKLNAQVGWQPKLDLDDGLQRAIAWWQHNLNSGDGG